MYRILVVDDTPNNLDLTSRILKRAGYGVDTAENGEEGVRMAGLWRYDLVVMDMAMPGINGGEATMQIRNAERTAGTRRVPVIAFTANALQEVRQRAMRSDMDDFITKPIEPRKLLAAVERSLDDRSIFLVADDCTPDRERTLRYLRALDRVGVVSASTGAEAIAACARQRITFALVNTRLSDVTGVEAAHQIRNSRYGDTIGIVVVSDKVDSDAREQYSASGYAGYLEKPIDQAAIVRVIGPLMAAG